MRTWWSAAVVSLGLVLSTAACGADDADIGTVPQPPPPGSPSTAASSKSTAEPPPPPRAGELTKATVKHTVRSSDLTVDVLYTPKSPVPTWTADGPKPIEVQVTLHSRKNPKQKIYLTRASMRFALNDGTGDIPGPDALVDTANITPGFLVTSPYSYVQSFDVPSIDLDTRTITMSVKLEMVTLVDGKSKDYTKQAVTDSISATTAF